MTVTQEVNQEPEKKAQVSDKELNFRKLEERYQRQLEQERAARLEAERIAEESRRMSRKEDDEEDDDEPYVDKKKLNKTLARFGEQSQQKTKSEIQAAIQQAREEARREIWLENNSDFYEVLEHAEKLAQKSPGLAKSILAMPDNFERQKLVYQNIKELGLHKPAQKEPTIQDKIDANKRGYYYQPTNVGTAPYQSAGDFSRSGQKNAYEKMKELQNRLGING